MSSAGAHHYYTGANVKNMNILPRRGNIFIMTTRWLIYIHLPVTAVFAGDTAKFGISVFYLILYNLFGPVYN